VALPNGAPTPTSAVCLYLSDDSTSFLWAAEFHQNLVQNHIIQDFEPGGTKSVRKNPRLTAISRDQFP